MGRAPAPVQLTFGGDEAPAEAWAERVGDAACQAAEAAFWRGVAGCAPLYGADSDIGSLFPAPPRTPALPAPPPHPDAAQRGAFAGRRRRSSTGTSPRCPAGRRTTCCRRRPCACPASTARWSTSARGDPSSRSTPRTPSCRASPTSTRAHRLPPPARAPLLPPTPLAATHTRRHNPPPPATPPPATSTAASAAATSPATPATSTPRATLTRDAATPRRAQAVVHRAAGARGARASPRRRRVRLRGGGVLPLPQAQADAARAVRVPRVQRPSAARAADGGHVCGRAGPPSIAPEPESGLPCSATAPPRSPPPSARPGRRAPSTLASTTGQTSPRRSTSPRRPRGCPSAAPPRRAAAAARRPSSSRPLSSSAQGRRGPRGRPSGGALSARAARARASPTSTRPTRTRPASSSSAWSAACGATSAATTATRSGSRRAARRRSSTASLAATRGAAATGAERRRASRPCHHEGRSVSSRLGGASRRGDSLASAASQRARRTRRWRRAAPHRPAGCLSALAAARGRTRSATTRTAALTTRSFPRACSAGGAPGGELLTARQRAPRGEPLPAGRRAAQMAGQRARLQPDQRPRPGRWTSERAVGLSSLTGLPISLGLCRFRGGEQAEGGGRFPARCCKAQAPTLRSRGGVTVGVTRGRLRPFKGSGRRRSATDNVI